jgi:predicted secreted protein
VELVLAQENNGETVRIPQGGSLSLELPQNGGTGYLWAVDDLDESVLEQTGTHVEHPAGLLPGAAASTRMSFLAKAAGSTHLTLHLRRDWERDSPADRFSVIVEVT